MKAPLSAILNNIVGKRCWYIAAGGSVGSMFNMHLGDKLPREKPLSTDNAIKKFQGEARVFVQDAKWELYERDQRIVFDESDSSPNGELAKGLNRLVGTRLTKFEIFGKLINLLFGEDLVLKIGLRKSVPEKESLPRMILIYGDERVSVD